MTNKPQDIHIMENDWEYTETNCFCMRNLDEFPEQTQCYDYIYIYSVQL